MDELLDLNTSTKRRAEIMFDRWCAWQPYCVNLKMHITKDDVVPHLSRCGLVDLVDYQYRAGKIAFSNADTLVQAKLMLGEKISNVRV